jgi:molybdenum cofactor biosynthesis enzyme MoaA
LSNIFGKLRSGASRTAWEASKIARVRKVEGEIAQLRKQIDTFQERLGEVTYLNHIHNEPQGQDAIDYIEKLKELEAELATKQEEISMIQAESYEESDAGSASGEIKCSNCGKINPANTKFCAQCGTKLS